jgi:hypothetical protein
MLDFLLARLRKGAPALLPDNRRTAARYPCDANEELQAWLGCSTGPP